MDRCLIFKLSTYISACERYINADFAGNYTKKRVRIITPLSREYDTALTLKTVIFHVLVYYIHTFPSQLHR